MVLDPRQRLSRICVFGMDRDEVGARLGELVDLGEEDAVGAHQVDVDRGFRGPGHLSDEVGEVEQRGGEMAVGHVDMKDVGMGRDAGQVIGETHEVCGPERVFGDEAVLRQGVEPVGHVRDP